MSLFHAYAPEYDRTFDRCRKKRTEEAPVLLHGQRKARGEPFSCADEEKGPYFDAGAAGATAFTQARAFSVRGNPM